MKPGPLKDLSLTRVIDAPRDLLWTCWTTPAHLRQFFVPKPHRVAACEIDLQVGGRFDTTMDVDGNLMENQGVFLEIVAGRRLVFTDAFRAGWEPAPDPFMTVLIDFADAGAGRTEITVTARHRRAEDRQRHEDMGFQDGWGAVLAQLEDHARSLG